MNATTTRLPRPAIPTRIAGAAAATRMQAALVALLVLALAATVFLARPREPAGLVWDEGYYVTSTQRYLDGHAQFATHPPLGLMLLAAGEALLQPNRALDTSHLGDHKHAPGEALPAGHAMTGMRLASGLAATLAALALAGLVLTVTRSLAAALVAVNLFVFDNAFVAHLRAAHLEAFQLLFALLALWAFASAVRRPARAGWREAAVGAFGALALLVKLNAAWLLAPAAVLVLHRLVTTPASPIGAAAKTAMRMLAAGVLATVLVLGAHVAIGHRMPDANTIAGRQDTAFIEGAYRAYLQGQRGIGPAVLLDAARGYARFMATDVDGMGLHDANGSTPWQWLAQRRTINYRWDSDGTRTAYVQLVPNPLGWLLALLAPLAVALLLALRLRAPASVRADAPLAWIAAALLAAWVACFGLHLWIASQRVMYLYHAFGGVLIGFALVPMAWQLATARWPGLRTQGGRPATALLALHLLAFWWLSPLSLHKPLTHAACQQRNWPLHIVECQP
ncbi:MAG: phospholipid carrier-dependent glycosyltransferase [Thermomonas sp.]|uniref:phospholipid carrier-dependent glycosyltransferase n=1 Tax=Thermomonas sp. TaxID=1971895 RepID=UPI0039E2A8B8